jgi:hypothetical protein
VVVGASGLEGAVKRHLEASRLVTR